MAGTLYLVATPIGNLDDMPPRVAATFGVTAGTTASAPGQPSAEVLKEKLFVSGQ